jgi:hypothetical protein
MQVRALVLLAFDVDSAMCLYQSQKQDVLTSTDIASGCAKYCQEG